MGQPFFISYKWINQIELIYYTYKQNGLYLNISLYKEVSVVNLIKKKEKRADTLQKIKLYILKI